jgi:hypothetical protein
MHDTAQDWRAAIAQAMGGNGGGSMTIELQHQPYAWLDGILLLSGMLILAGVWQ